MSWNLKEIYKALNKKFNHTENIEFQKISIDSRKISSEDFFIRIVGEKIFWLKIVQFTKFL